MKAIDVSPRVLVLLLSALLVGAVVWANSHGGITPSLAAILGSIAGSIPKMLERPSVFGGTADTPSAPPKASTIAADLVSPTVGAIAAMSIALTMGG